ncbi:uncharacterized protein LOC124250186 [Equus quagga]|uniref:uncharacterized protein LOC124250186 n=1 Tax=Equus quagga TaxID=89248 RepID=UPI001EE1EA44|nr:uncharacterized protein LOC124250186 [Equus quagga]
MGPPGPYKRTLHHTDAIILTLSPRPSLKAQVDSWQRKGLVPQKDTTLLEDEQQDHQLISLCRLSVCDLGGDLYPVSPLLYKGALCSIVAILLTLKSPTALENQVPSYPERCPISSRSNASSPASPLLCAHLPSVQSHAHLLSVQSHAHLRRFHLNSASRSVLLCSHHHHASRSDHPKAARAKAIKAIMQEKQIVPPISSSFVVSSLKPVLVADGAP